jgi:hypothetical protein
MPEKKNYLSKTWLQNGLGGGEQILDNYGNTGTYNFKILILTLRLLGDKLFTLAVIFFSY